MAKRILLASLVGVAAFVTLMPALQASSKLTSASAASFSSGGFAEIPALTKYAQATTSSSENETVESMTDDVVKALTGKKDEADQRKNDKTAMLNHLADEVVDAITELSNTNGDGSGNPKSVNESVNNVMETLTKLTEEAVARGVPTNEVYSLLTKTLAARPKEQLPGAFVDEQGRFDFKLLLSSIVSTTDTSQIKSVDQNYIAALQSESDGTVVDQHKLDFKILLANIVSKIDPSQIRSVDQQYVAVLESEGDGTVIEQLQKSAGVEEVDGVRYLRVKRGHTLGHIALQVYGDALLYLKIFNANRETLKNPNLISVGMRLRIPRLTTAGG